MHLSIACLCVALYMYMYMQNCVECVCDVIFSHVHSVWETGHVLIDERVFVLMSLQSGFTLREILFLTILLPLKISEAYSISLLQLVCGLDACLTMCVLLVYVCVAYVIFMIHARVSVCLYSCVVFPCFHVKVQ